MPRRMHERPQRALNNASTGNRFGPRSRRKGNSTDRLPSARMGASASFEQSRLNVIPGEHTETQLRVRNTGSVVDQFTFEAIGDGADWITVAPAEFSLFPAAEETVVVSIDAPRAPTTRQGPTPFAVRVRVEGGPDRLRGRRRRARRRGVRRPAPRAAPGVVVEQPPGSPRARRRQPRQRADPPGVRGDRPRGSVAFPDRPFGAHRRAGYGRVHDGQGASQAAVLARSAQAAAVPDRGRRGRPRPGDRRRRAAPAAPPAALVLEGGARRAPPPAVAVHPLEDAARTVDRIDRPRLGRGGGGRRGGSDRRAARCGWDPRSAGRRGGARRRGAGRRRARRRPTRPPARPRPRRPRPTPARPPHRSSRPRRSPAVRPICHRSGSRSTSVSRGRRSPGDGDQLVHRAGRSGAVDHRHRAAEPHRCHGRPAHQAVGDDVVRDPARQLPRPRLPLRLAVPVRGGRRPSTSK